MTSLIVRASSRRRFLQYLAGSPYLLQAQYRLTARKRRKRDKLAPCLNAAAIDAYP